MKPRAVALALAGIVLASPGLASARRPPGLGTAAAASPERPAPREAPARAERDFPWAWVALGGAAAAAIGILVVGRALDSDSVTVRGRAP